MKNWGTISSKQRKYIQKLLARHKGIAATEEKLTQSEANETIDAALEALSSVITY